MAWAKLLPNIQIQVIATFCQVKFDVIYCISEVILRGHSGKVKYGARICTKSIHSTTTWSVLFVLAAVETWQYCHSFAFIHQSLNDSIVSYLVWTDLREESEPGWALKLKTSLRKTSVQLFQSTAVKARLSSILLSLSQRKSHTGHHSMFWSVVFNKASEELSTPACSVRLISMANIYVS